MHNVIIMHCCGGSRTFSTGYIFIQLL